MSRTLLMIAAVALLLTQCRKPVVEYPTAGPANENMVSMTVTVGHGGKTDINGNTGAITWSTGDKLYVGDGSKYIGCLTLVSGVGEATGSFSGSVIAPSSTTFGLYYLGGKTPAGLTEGTSTSVDISFASQTGLIGDLSDCHIGYGTATGKVEDGNVVLDNPNPVTMTNKVAIAYFEFKENGTSDYTGAITLSGDNIYNKMTVKFNGAESDMFTGNTVGDISLTSTSSSRKYVMLVPTGTGEETLEFGGGAEGTTKFYKGIEANKFYCVGAGQPIEVAVTAPSYLPGEFTVDGSGNKVKFSKGNLYYDGSSWNFESNQYDYRTYAGKNSCIGGSVTEDCTPSGHWGLFGWSTDATTYGMSTSTGDIYSGETLKDWGKNDIGTDAADTWRTLSKAEWDYLMNTRTASTIGSTSNARCAEVKVNGVSGMMLFPDTFTWPSEVTTKPTTFNTYSSTWNDGVNYSTVDFGLLESAGVVFLPAAGSRYGTSASFVGSSGYYWSSTPSATQSAYVMGFGPGSMSTAGDYRYDGNAVRLVRSAAAPTPTHEYVDLGLSVKWATCNLGASKPRNTETTMLGARRRQRTIIAGAPTIGATAQNSPSPSIAQAQVTAPLTTRPL